MKKKLTTLALMLALILSLAPGALAQEAEPEEKDPAEGSEEVIYGILEADGEVEELIAVVILNSESESKKSYYGDFEQVKNLSDTRELDLEKDGVSLLAPEGRFYFQAELENERLPWKIDISYSLDGEKISPDELGGKSGRLEIDISTAEDPKLESDFFDAYLLQISLTLDAQNCVNIQAEGATTANSGGSKMISFTVLPGTEAQLHLAADVTDFSMPGMTISAVPYSMGDAMDGVDELSQGLAQLSYAISQLNSGASSLSSGASQLQSGAAQFGDGLYQLSANSAQLVDGSQQILDGIRALEQLLGLGGDGPSFPEGMDQLPELLRSLGVELGQAADELGLLADNTAAAVADMSGSLDGIVPVSEDEIAALQAACPDSAALSQLISNHRLALQAKETWTQASQTFSQAGERLSALAGELRLAADSASALAEALELFINSDGGAEFEDMLESLSSVADLYEQFHNGLTAYTGGVDALAAAWPELYDGICQISGGTSQLAGGTAQLNAGTSGIPQQVDSMISGFTGGDFQPRSFLSEKNGNVDSVQFVLSTQAISAPAAEAAAQEAAPEETGLAVFISRLKALFQPDED